MAKNHRWWHEDTTQHLSIDTNDRFNAGELPQGVYMVRVVTVAGVLVSRLVKV